MKKILALVLALAMVLGLAACGSSGSGSGSGSQSGSQTSNSDFKVGARRFWPAGPRVFRIFKGRKKVAQFGTP